MPDLHTETILRQLESFSAYQDEVYRELSPYSDCADLTALRMLGENFRRKAADFFRASRKYNLAVIGRVKAGKTSFLNTLLFEGREILPKDSVPKTAALTRIEYAERNEIEIEFYSPEDWVWLRRLASSKEESDRAKAARETVRAAESSGLPVSELLFGGTKLEIFKSIEEMTGRLNEFVGQNGAYTPLVKAATIRFHLEALKGISVVDTPGLNDPIPSRTERTREFIETCDAAFFLSRASYFLDQNDIDLLTETLPQKGIRRLVLIASQFDSAVMDLISDFDSLEETVDAAKAQLRRHAEKSVGGAVLALRKSGASSSIVDVVQQCREPIFLSAMAEDLSRIPAEKDTEQQAIVRRHLESFGPLSAADLHRIGNMDEVRAVFSDMLAEREELLRQKAAAMASIGKADLECELRRLRAFVKRETAESFQLQKEDAQAKIFQSAEEINRFRDAVGAAYAEYRLRLDDRMRLASEKLRIREKQAPAAAVKQAVEVRTEETLVDDMVFFKPWTWGKKHVEFESSERRYSYMDSADAAESLRQAAAAAQYLHDSVFLIFEEKARLCNALMNAAAGAFAGAEFSADREQIARWAQIAGSRIIIPKAEIDPSPYVAAIGTKYPKQIRTERHLEELKKDAQEQMTLLVDEAVRKLRESAAAFLESVTSSESRFESLVLAQRSKETASCRNALAQAEQEISRRKEFLEVLDANISE